MALNLTIDQGNSEAKMALWDDARLLDFRVAPVLTPSCVDAFVGTRKPLDGAIYCSVKREDLDLVCHLRRLARIVMRLGPESNIPISIDYATPQTLGSDRVAAAVGAWEDHQGHPILVVDAGTAVTYDFVDPSGCYRGGNIAPGISLNLRALHDYTARLPLVPFPSPMKALTDRLFGTDTRGAIARGAVDAVRASIIYYRSQLPDDTRVVLGGGCGRHLATVLDFPVFVDEHLVSKGLNRILIYNEQ